MSSHYCSYCCGCPNTDQYLTTLKFYVPAASQSLLVSLFLVLGISLPSLSTHQQLPEDWLHCSGEYPPVLSQTGDFARCPDWPPLDSFWHFVSPANENKPPTFSQQKLVPNWTHSKSTPTSSRPVIQIPSLKRLRSWYAYHTTGVAGLDPQYKK